MWTSMLTEFASETFVFGWHLLRPPISRLERVFWLALVAGLFGLTVYELSDLAQRYNYENAAADVQISDSFPFTVQHSPSVILTTECFDDVLNTNRAPITTEVDMLSDLKSFCKSFSQTEVTKVDATIFDPLMYAAWGVSLIDSSAMLNQSLTDDGVFAKLPPEVQSNETMRQAVLSAYTFCAHEGRVDWIKLKNLLVKQFCRNVDFSIRLLSTDMAKTTVNCDDIGFLKFGQFYDRYYGFIGQVDVRVLASKSYSNWPDFVASWNCSRACVAAIDLSRTAHTTAGTLGPFEPENVIQVNCQPGKDQKIAIRPIALVRKTRDAKSRPCDESLTHSACVDTCFGQRFADCFGRWPSFMLGATHRRRFMPTSVIRNSSSICKGQLNSDCVAQRLQNCAVGLSSFDVMFELCRKVCPPDCERTLWISTQQQADNPSGASKCTVTVYVSEYSYILFEERLEMSLHSFLSQLGGIVGLYLGISVAAAMHTPVFLLRKLLGAAFSRKGLKSLQKEPEMDVNVQLLECERCSSARRKDTAEEANVGELRAVVAAMEEKLETFDRRLTLLRITGMEPPGQQTSRTT